MSDDRKRHRSAPSDHNQSQSVAMDTSTTALVSLDEGIGSNFSSNSNLGSLNSLRSDPNSLTELDTVDMETEDVGIIMGDDDINDELVRTKASGPFQIFYVDIPLVNQKLVEAWSQSSQMNNNGRRPSNMDRINFIIDSYNKHLQENGETELYTRKDFLAKFDHMRSPFRLEIFTKIETYRDDETDGRMTSLSKIRFLHWGDDDDDDDTIKKEEEKMEKKMGEIFILPSQSGYHVAKNWVSCEFPLSIASAILAEHSTDEKTIKNFFGNRHFQSYKMKRKECLTNQEAGGLFLAYFSPQICTKFRAVVINTNVKHLLGRNKGELKLEVSTKSLCFRCPINGMDGYASLCHLLSDIHADRELTRSPEYFSNLIPVGTNLTERLDQLLRQEFENLFINLTNNGGVNHYEEEELEAVLEKSKLNEFNVTQSDFNDYVHASQYHLQMGKKSIKNFHSFPSLREICDALKPFVLARDPKHLETLMDTLTMSWSAVGFKKNKMSTPQTLISCLEGIFYAGDVFENEQNFWRLGGNWYAVSCEYAFEVHREFHFFLQKNFLPLQTSHQLTVPWPKKLPIKRPPSPRSEEQSKIYHGQRIKYELDPLIKENDYLNMAYGNQQNLIICDGNFTQHEIELCDLLEYRPENEGLRGRESTIFIYHVKKYFHAQDTRVVTGQIMNSAFLLNAAIKMGPAKSSRSVVRKLFDWALTRKEDNFVKRRFSKNFTEFRTALRNATFVQAIVQKSETTYNFEVDRNLTKWTFRWTDFREKIEQSMDPDQFIRLTNRRKIFFDGLPHKLSQWLRTHGFIDLDNNFTPAWWRGCGSVADDGGFSEDGIMKNFPGDSKGNLPRHKLFSLLKNEYFTKHQGLPPKQQVLATAEALQSLGFGFKICEIPMGNVMDI